MSNFPLKGFFILREVTGPSWFASITQLKQEHVDENFEINNEGVHLAGITLHCLKK